MRQAMIGALTALGLVPSAGSPQVGRLHFGVAPQYVVLTGDPYGHLPNGLGLNAFAGYRLGAAVLRLGAGLSSHADEIGDVRLGSWLASGNAVSSAGRRQWHQIRVAAFTEMRYSPPTQSFTAPEFVGLRVGWSRVSGLNPSGAWNAEVTLGTTVPLRRWLRAEFSATAGIARYVPQTYFLHRWGNTFSVATGLVATPVPQ